MIKLYEPAVDIKALRKEQELISKMIKEKHQAWKDLDDEMQALVCNHETLQMNINSITNMS